MLQILCLLDMLILIFVKADLLFNFLYFTIKFSVRYLNNALDNSLFSTCFYFFCVCCERTFWWNLYLCYCRRVFPSRSVATLRTHPSITSSKIYCRFSSVSAIKAVSSAYLKLIALHPLITNPCSSSISFKITALYNENKNGDNTQPCRIPLLILIQSPSTHTHICVYIYTRTHA